MIVQLKENQPTLCQKIEAVCRDSVPLGIAKTTDRKKRNRSETRTTRVFSAAAAVRGTEWEAHVAAIIQVERTVHTRHAATGIWTCSEETSLYLSNRPIEAEQASDVIRKHWAIENTSHHTRDVTFREDASRIRCNPGIFARIRSFAYNILRFNKTDTTPQDRYAAALGGLPSLLSMHFCLER